MNRRERINASVLAALIGSVIVKHSENTEVRQTRAGAQTAGDADVDLLFETTEACTTDW